MYFIKQVRVWSFLFKMKNVLPSILKLPFISLK